MRTSEQVFFEMLVIRETMVQQGEMKWNKLKDNEMVNHISCPLRCRFVGWGYYVPSRWDEINFTINDKVFVTGARWVGCSNRVRWTWDKLNEIIRTDALWGVSYGSGHELPRWDKVRWSVRTGALWDVGYVSYHVPPGWRQSWPFRTSCWPYRCRPRRPQSGRSGVSGPLSYPRKRCLR